MSGQLAGFGSIFTFVFVSSLAVWLALKVIVGIRVSEEDELEGVDIAECGMQAYPEFVGGHFATSDSPTGGGETRGTLMSGILTPTNSTVS